MKNKGSSLIYVLILLSVLSVLNLSYVSFVNNKNKILKLEKVKLDKKILKKRLIKKEKRQIEILNSKEYGIYSYIFFLMKTNFKLYNYKKSDASYFEDTLISGENGKAILDMHLIYITKYDNIKKTKLIYSKEGTKSVGGYTIEKITNNGKILKAPLEKKDYGEIEVIYHKNILKTDIYIKQHMKFRKNKKNKYLAYSVDYKFLENKE